MAKSKTNWQVPKNYRDFITEGQDIKNYPKLCELMGWKETTGASKVSQIKEFDRFFIYDKDGQSYIITSILEEPLPEIKVDYARNTKYSEDVKALLISLAKVREGKGYVTITNRRLYTALGFGNTNYYDASGKTYEEKLDIAKQLNVNQHNYIEFIDAVSQSARSAVETAIKGLMRDRIIRNYKYTFCIAYLDGEFKRERKATQLEHNIIFDVEYKAYTKLGYKSIREALFGAKDQYEEIVNEQLTEKLEDIDYLYHYSYHYFDFNSSIIEDAYLRHEIGDKILELNRRFRDEQYKSFDKRSFKANDIVDYAQDFLIDEQRMEESIMCDTGKGKSSKEIRDAQRAIRRGDGTYLKEMEILSDIYIPVLKSELDTSSFYNEIWS